MDNYKVITDRIIKLLEQGTVPWRRPWSAGAAVNLATGKEYRGVNRCLLACAGYSSPQWGTLKQINAKGGRVNRGAESTPVVFWSKVNPPAPKKDSSEPARKPYFLLRMYRVFNIEQTTLPKPQAPERMSAPERIAACESVVASMPRRPAIAEDGGGRAYYVPATDSVHLPAIEQFASNEEYYSTLFHELTHSTGHKSRLGRTGIVEHNGFGTERYSQEELVAEMGASFLAAETGIDQVTLDNSAAYVASWLRKLKDDPKLVVLAAGQAQKAADYILARKGAAE